jgi:hypothetical protein
VSREKVNSGIDSIYIEFVAIVHSVTDRSNPKCGYNLYTNPYWNTDEKHGHDTTIYVAIEWSPTMYAIHIGSTNAQERLMKIYKNVVTLSMMQ